MNIEAILDYYRQRGLHTSDLEELPIDQLRGHVTEQHACMIESWAPVELATMTLQPADVNRLVFIENDDTRAVTVNGRSLAAVADFIVATGLGDVLDSDPWFGRVRTIFEDFDSARFDPLLLTPAKDNERLASGGADWYLEDGNHRALALALRIRLGLAAADVPAVVVFRSDQPSAD